MVVELDSRGGDVIESERIGQEIRSRFFMTRVSGGGSCASACVLILAAGVDRIVLNGARIGIHRPSFDPLYFAGLTAEEARAKYNAMLGDVKRCLVEIGAPEALFDAMVQVPSSSVRVLKQNDLGNLGLAGEDPAWDELSEANQIKQFGKKRWQWIKTCQGRAHSSTEAINCFAQSYTVYPDQ